MGLTRLRGLARIAQRWRGGVPGQAEPTAQGADAAPPQAPLLSEHWFRVADLRPLLRTGVALERVRYRGQPWMVLTSADGSRRLRLNAAAYALVGRCDGRLSVQALWDLLLRERQDDAPTQDELISQLLQLVRDGFIGFDTEPDFGLLMAEAPAAQALGGDTATTGPAVDAGQRGAAPRNTLLAWRIPLGRPDAALTRAAPLARALFGPAGLALWCAGLLLGAAALLQQRAEIADFAGRWLHSPSLLALSALLFPLMKAWHEAAHGLALKRLGMPVPQWGITLMVGLPVPWVDASAADALPLARQRLLVSAAGVMAELGAASGALAASLLLQPGALRDACWLVFAIGALSSLLVNANPLLRFDGYHALCDALELPNLAGRSSRHWLALWRRMLGLPAAAGALQPARGETPWLWAYAPLAWAWRLLLSLAIALWAGSLSAWLGVAVTLLVTWGLLVQPALRGLRWLAGTGLDASQAARARLRAAAATAGLAALLLALPWPDASLTRGVLWLPDDALVRAQTAGFVDAVQVVDGQTVAAGDRLFELHNPSLAVEAADLDSQITERRIEHQVALADEPARAQRLAADLAQALAARERVAQRQQQLVLVAARAGTVSVQRAADWQGRYVAQGTVLARVIPTEDAAAADPAQALSVRLALPAEEAAWLRQQPAQAQVRLPGPDGLTVPATLRHDFETATHELPSAALGDRHGGPIATDPADRSGRTTAAGVVLLDLALPPGSLPPGTGIGTRVWVRLDRGSQPLAVQLARRAQQAVLLHFNPQR